MIITKIEKEMEEKIDLRTVCERKRDERYERIRSEYKRIRSLRPDASLNRIYIHVATIVGCSAQTVKNIVKA